jgi:hypothetical protein
MVSMADYFPADAHALVPVPLRRASNWLVIRYLRSMRGVWLALLFDCFSFCGV